MRLALFTYTDDRLTCNHYDVKGTPSVIYTQKQIDKQIDAHTDKYDIKVRISPCAQSLIASPFGLAIIAEARCAKG